MGVPEEEVDIVSLYKQFAAQLQDLVRKAAAREDRAEIDAAAWKAYEAWVQTAHVSIERAVATPAVGDAAAAALNIFLRAAQIGNSIVGSLFAPVWPLIGLTPLTETQALFDRIETLRREVRQLNEPRSLRATEPVAPPRRASARSRRGQNINNAEKKSEAPAAS
jgi:hypothetical protein